MAQIGQFDATTVAPREDYTPLPTGEYRAQIVDSDLKPTKNNDGHYAELVFECMDAPHKGRKVWARLNLDNKNPKAVEIAQRDLSAICHATGRLQIKDTFELHNKPLIIRVEFVKADGLRQKNDGNEIRAYKAIDGGTPVAASAPVAAQAASAPPWQTKAAA
jgi:hypothetical protein